MGEESLEFDFDGSFDGLPSMGHIPAYDNRFSVCQYVFKGEYRTGEKCGDPKVWWADGGRRSRRLVGGGIVMCSMHYSRYGARKRGAKTVRKMDDPPISAVWGTRCRFEGCKKILGPRDSARGYCRNHFVKAGKSRINKDGYKIAPIGVGGVIREHRLVMEVKVGRPLMPDEDVDHIDGDKLNNNPDNLRIKFHGEHGRGIDMEKLEEWAETRMSHDAKARVAKKFIEKELNLDLGERAKEGIWMPKGDPRWWIIDFLASRGLVPCHEIDLLPTIDQFEK